MILRTRNSEILFTDFWRTKVLTWIRGQYLARRMPAVSPRYSLLRVLYPSSSLPAPAPTRKSPNYYPGEEIPNTTRGWRCAALASHKHPQTHTRTRFLTDRIGTQWELGNLERAMRMISDQIRDEGLDMFSDPSALVVGDTRPRNVASVSDVSMAEERFSSQRISGEHSLANSACGSQASSTAGSRRGLLRGRSRMRASEGTVTKPLMQTQTDGSTVAFEIASGVASQAASSLSRASSSSLNYMQGFLKVGSPSNRSTCSRQNSISLSRGSFSCGSVSPDRRSPELRARSRPRTLSGDSNRTESSLSSSEDASLSPEGRSGTSKPKLTAHLTSHHASAPRNIPAPRDRFSLKALEKELGAASSSKSSDSSFGDLEIANPRPTLRAGQSGKKCVSGHPSPHEHATFKPESPFSSPLAGKAAR